MSAVLVRKILAPALLGLAMLVATACSPGPSPAPQSTPTATAEEQSAATAVTAPAESTASPRREAPGTPVTAGVTATVRRTATATARATPTATRARSVGTPWGTPLPTLAAGQTYRDPQGRFSFTIPNNWTQVQAAGADVAFQSPAPANAVPATVNVVLEKLPSASVSLDEYDRAGEANLKQQFSDYRLISHTPVSVAGRPAYKRVYTATIANRLLQLQQIYLIDRDTAYIVSCGATQDTFATYTAVFDQISGTFTIGVP